MTVTQTVEFVENKDASVISYHQFNQGPSDKYPTFSICIKGSAIYWRKEGYLFDIAGMTSDQYVAALKGDGFRFQFNETTFLYEKRMVDIKNVLDIEFEEITSNPADIIVAGQLLTENKGDNSHFGKQRHEGLNLAETPFYIGYQ